MTHFDPELGRSVPPTPEARPSLTNDPVNDIFAKSEFYNSLIQIVIVAAAAIALIFALLP